jgi:hypothetical protein
MELLRSVSTAATQKDIVEVAKCFTGWTIADRAATALAANMITGEEDKRMERLQRQACVPDDIESGEFFFNQRWHESEAKRCRPCLTKASRMAKLSTSWRNSLHMSSLPARGKVVTIIRAKLLKRVQIVHEIERRHQNDVESIVQRQGILCCGKHHPIKTPSSWQARWRDRRKHERRAGDACDAISWRSAVWPSGSDRYPDTAEDWVNTGAFSNG